MRRSAMPCAAAPLPSGVIRSLYRHVVTATQLEDTCIATQGARTLADNLYEKLVNEEDARVCTEISDEACRETPRNFLLILLSNGLTKLGDALASPKTLLPWMSAAIMVPAWIIGLLVPLRESGSLIPQLAIASYIRRLGVRKWVWVTGSVVQGITVLGLALVSVTLQGNTAGYAILALVILFSLARGFCSVASKDVLGKTVPKSRRGQLTGWSASAAGGVTVGLALTLLVVGGVGGVGDFYTELLIGAGLLWCIAAVFFAGVSEFAGETEGGGNALSEAIRRLSILGTDRDFRRFIVARALLMCSALSAPFYVLLGQERLGSAPALLALFLGAGGLASLVSGPVWGRFADSSSRKVMAAAAAVSSGAGLVLVLLAELAPDLLAPVWVIPVAYFVLSVAHAGVRVGRKTYVVDLASGNRRTDYVAVGNSVIGVLLLCAGAIGGLSDAIGITGVIAVLSVMGALGSALCLALRET